MGCPSSTGPQCGRWVMHPSPKAVQEVFVRACARPIATTRCSPRCGLGSSRSSATSSSTWRERVGAAGAGARADGRAGDRRHRRRVRSRPRVVAGRRGVAARERRAPTGARRGARARARVPRSCRRSRGCRSARSRVGCTTGSRLSVSRSKSWGGWTMSDACREWQGKLAATAAGRPDPDKHPRVVAHLDGCVHCRQELAELSGSPRRCASSIPTVSRTRHTPQPPLPTTW